MPGNKNQVPASLIRLCACDSAPVLRTPEGVSEFFKTSTAPNATIILHEQMSSAQVAVGLAVGGASAGLGHATACGLTRVRHARMRTTGRPHARHGDSAE